MKLVVSKNAFGIVASLLLLAVLLSSYALLRAVGLPWWVSLLYAVALGLAVGPLKRRWALLDWLFGGDAHIDAIQIGAISFILLSAPDYTTTRKLITCCIFVFWLSVVVIPLVLWSDHAGVLITALLFALISGPLILNTIEKRWLAQGKREA